MPLAPAVIGIILSLDKRQILLVQRKDIPVWVLPGGGIDPHETAEEALVREILEETGFTVEIQRKCAEYTPINRLTAPTSTFLCSIKQGMPILSSETAAINFFPLNQLPRLFFHVHEEWLDEALTHSTLIQKPLTHITYLKLAKYFCRHPWLILRYAWTRWGFKKKE